MFCNQCGQANSNDAKFCSGCGNKLEIQNIQAVHAPPQLEKNESPQPRKKQIELWNPNAAANWSLLFTPIFGSYLQMKNWQALGEQKEANTAKSWLIFTIVFILFINFLSYLADADPEQSTIVARGLGFWYIIIWYFAYARKQPKYVKETLNDRYQKKSWWIPLVSATVILFVATFIFMVVGSSLVQQKNSTQDNQPQQITTQQNNNISVDNSQQKPWEMDWSNAKSSHQNQTFSSKNPEWLEKIYQIQEKVNSNQISLIESTITNKPNNAKYNRFLGIDLESKQTWWKTNDGTIYIHLINNKFPVYGLVFNAYHGLCDKNNETGYEFSIESKSIIQPFSEVVLSFHAPEYLNHPSDQCLNIINAWWYE